MSSKSAPPTAASSTSATTLGRLLSATVDFTRDTLGREARRTSTTSSNVPTPGVTAAPTRLHMLREYDAMDRLIRQHVAAPEPGLPARAISDRAWRYDQNGRPTT